MQDGLIQVYTGDGKGKTTAAIGLIMRAHGRGLKAGLIQFLKGADSGELKILKTLGIPYCQFGSGKFILEKPTKADIDLAEKGLETVEKTWHKYDLLVLDEISYLINFQIIPERSIIRFLKGKPKHLELVLTGRAMPDSIIELASLVTSMQKLKHPYDLGISARKGIEY